MTTAVTPPARLFGELVLADVGLVNHHRQFEMEQILPGADEDDWDSDLIIEAADLHHAGHHREAIRILEDALAIDMRCIDAWGTSG